MDLNLHRLGYSITKSIPSVLISLATVIALILSTGPVLCQDHGSLDFNDCENYEDTCLCIGNKFIKKLQEKKFEGIADLFSEDFLFRALIPSSLVTSNNPLKAALEFKRWFYVEDPGRYEILDSKTDVMVDCLHIYYKIFRTYKSNSYHVEQHLFCEVSNGKIQKLSLICSGFRKVNI